MFNAYFIAEQLGKTLDEVLEFPLNRFAGWIAYFKLKADMTKKAQRKAQAISSRSRTRKS